MTMERSRAPFGVRHLAMRAVASASDEARSESNELDCNFSSSLVDGDGRHQANRVSCFVWQRVDQAGAGKYKYSYRVVLEIEFLTG